MLKIKVRRAYEMTAVFEHRQRLFKDALPHQGFVLVILVADENQVELPRK